MSSLPDNDCIIAEPNRTPTQQEISWETLHLDAYGMTASRLAEAQGVDEADYLVKQKWLMDPLTDAMAEDGWTYGGAGFFAAVFVKGGLALKFGFKVGDMGSMYAAWCRSNQGRPGVPTVYSLSKFSGCYVLLTRRYDTLREEWLDDDHEEFIPEIYAEYRALHEAVSFGTNVGRARFDTVSTGTAIHDFFSGVVDFDMHEANVMMDQWGDLVITDPISYGPCSNYGYYTDTCSTQY